MASPLMVVQGSAWAAIVGGAFWLLIGLAFLRWRSQIVLIFIGLTGKQSIVRPTVTFFTWGSISVGIIFIVGGIIELTKG